MMPSIPDVLARLLDPRRGTLDLSASPGSDLRLLDRADVAERFQCVLLNLDEFLHYAGCDDHEMTTVHFDDMLVGLVLPDGPMPSGELLRRRLADWHLLGAHLITWSASPNRAGLDAAIAAEVLSAGMVPAPHLDDGMEEDTLLQALQNAGVDPSLVVPRLPSVSVRSSAPDGFAGLLLEIPWESGPMPAFPATDTVGDTPVSYCLRRGLHPLVDAQPDNKWSALPI